MTTAWREDGERVRGAAGQIAGRLADAAAATLPPAAVDAAGLAAALDNLREGFDEQDGGFGGAPKFPPSMVVGVPAAPPRAHRLGHRAGDGRR